MTTSHILMIRPANFGYNPQTAANNNFQKKLDTDSVQEKALQEFDNFVALLRENDVNVMVVEDSSQPHTPDSIFPNNWVSFHEDGTLVLYPMFAENRRLEREKKVIEQIDQPFFIRSVTHLISYEKRNEFLEGTGSMVLDRDHELAYACLSARTHPTVLYDFANEMGYQPVLFNATDREGRPIYHTNVMMCVADEYAVICLEAIPDDFQKKMLLQRMEETEKTVIDISLRQMEQFAGNMLQVNNTLGEKLLVMSASAFKSLRPEQVQLLESFNRILFAPLDTIEQNGGGSARCMMAEIFLPEKI